MMFDAITTMAPNVRSGKLKGLATSGRTRSSVLPEVPTLAEAGVPGYESTIWLGIMAPTGTARAITERLNAEITRIANSAEIKEAWAKQGAVPYSMSVDQFAQHLRDDIAKWAKVVKLSGAKVD
jgi:tripartite-type tricarboxylate transporter receptor subunit TctC